VLGYLRQPALIFGILAGWGSFEYLKRREPSRATERDGSKPREART
jgi:hypothetical protein